MKFLYFIFICLSISFSHDALAQPDFSATTLAVHTPHAVGPLKAGPEFTAGVGLSMRSKPQQIDGAEFHQSNVHIWNALRFPIAKRFTLGVVFEGSTNRWSASHNKSRFGDPEGNTLISIGPTLDLNVLSTKSPFKLGFNVHPHLSSSPWQTWKQNESRDAFERERAEPNGGFGVRAGVYLGYEANENFRITGGAYFSTFNASLSYRVPAEERRSCDEPRWFIIPLPCDSGYRHVGDLSRQSLSADLGIKYTSDHGLILEGRAAISHTTTNGEKATNDPSFHVGIGYAFLPKKIEVTKD